MIDKKQYILDVLNQYSVLSAKEIANFIIKHQKVSISPNSISGILRSMESRGEVGSSKSGNSAKVYWIIKEVK